MYILVVLEYLSSNALCSGCDTIEHVEVHHSLDRETLSHAHIIDRMFLPVVPIVVHVKNCLDTYSLGLGYQVPYPELDIVVVKAVVDD